MDKPDPESESSPEAEAGSGGPGKLTLPGVILADNAKSEGDQSCPAQTKMDQAVTQQEDLMAEFQGIAEELRKLVADLEGSTFVKRLKSMARKQLEVASDVNAASGVHFGKRNSEVAVSVRKRAALIAKRQTEYRELVGYIYDDLEAYSNRSNDGKFKTVLLEMKQDDLSSQLEDLAIKIDSNEPGASKVHAELLADTFDRWAEQLVGPG
jgi:outer membrane murein-binding lipoprotein Lpp